MVTFSVPVKTKSQAAFKGCFKFSVQNMSVLFAGSRYGAVPLKTCSLLIEQFHLLGFGFYTGGAPGVDACFRKALSLSPCKDRTFVACAFKSRTKAKNSYGLFASVVVPKNLHPKAALYRRTLWMVRRCSLVVLFPKNPYSHFWGKGSTLTLTQALYNLKPVFVVGSTPPKKSYHYHVLPSDLFATVQGYWVVPHPIEQGGTCDDEY